MTINGICPFWIRQYKKVGGSGAGESILLTIDSKSVGLHA